MRPATMKVIEDGFVSEAMLSLKHVDEVSKVFASERSSNCHCGNVTCYVTASNFV